MTEQEKCAKIIALATKQIGIVEEPKGSNKVKFNKWFYKFDVQDGFDLKGNKNNSCKYPWCFTFCSWVYWFSGMPFGIIDYTRGGAGVPYGLKNVYKWGRVVAKDQVRPGYLVIFDWNVDKTPDHIGIFLKDNGNGTFDAIEGNTAVGNDSNGGEVMQRNRSYRTAIFVRPNALDREVRTEKEFIIS